MTTRTIIQIGDWVRLTHRLRVQERSHGKAQVEAFYKDISGGVVLKTPLAGFRSWNVKDFGAHPAKEAGDEMTIREGSPCGCGSSKPRRALYDGNGFFCAYVCDDCEQKVRARYRPEIMNRHYDQNDVDEDIYGDD